MTRVEEIYRQVKSLSPEERDELDLLFMQEAESAELSPEWRAEIDRRIADWKSGRAKSLSWDEVREGLWARINAAKV